MSEHDHDDLGPKPEAVIEPGEPNPGGVDALDVETDDPVPADIPIEVNPAVDTTATPELAEGEDTSTKATQGESSDADEEDPV